MTAPYVYYVLVDDRYRCFASLLPSSIAFHSGLPTEAIMGEFTSGIGTQTPQAFLQNPTFIEFMYYAISQHVSSCPDIIAAAQRQHNGFVWITDPRAGVHPDVIIATDRQKDVLGYVQIENGEMLLFRGSPNYRLLTSDGFMQLEPWLKDRLVEQLVAIATGGGGSTGEPRGNPVGSGRFTSTEPHRGRCSPLRRAFRCFKF